MFLYYLGHMVTSLRKDSSSPPSRCGSKDQSAPLSILAILGTSGNLQNPEPDTRSSLPNLDVGISNINQGVLQRPWITEDVAGLILIYINSSHYNVYQSGL